MNACSSFEGFEGFEVASDRRRETMAQHYSDPKRAAEDAYALPNIETFKYRRGFVDEMADEEGVELEDGWYYWFCFPGCLPDSEPSGPFETEAAALEDARDGLDDGLDDEEEA